MVTSGLTVLLSALALLPHGSIATTLHTHVDMKDGARLVRRETQQLELTPHAEMLVNDDQSRLLRASQGVDDVVDDQSLLFCDFDFVLGKEGSNDCLDPSLEHPIDETACLLAGNESGAGVDHNLFRIPVANQNDHPKGCFKTHCGKYVKDAPASDACYFWNDIESPMPTGAKGTGPEGTPICSRHRWWDGVNDSLVDDGGCPTGYMVVHSEAVCQEAARCRMEVADPEFLVGVKNASVHLDHPKGCFFDHDMKEVFYNDPTFFEEGVSLTNVRGMPICIVSQVLHWGADGGHASTSSSSTGGNSTGANASSF